jgi:hypothetical protein
VLPGSLARELSLRAEEERTTVSLSVCHWTCWDDGVIVSDAGMGGNGSRGVFTTIEGVVRIPCVGDFMESETEAGGIGIWSVGLGGRMRCVIVLERVGDWLL